MQGTCSQGVNGRVHGLLSSKLQNPRSTFSCLSKVVFPHTQRKEGHLGGIHCQFRETWISQCSKKGIQTPKLLCPYTVLWWDALCWQVDPTNAAFPFLYVATQPFTLSLEFLCLYSQFGCLRTHRTWDQLLSADMWLRSQCCTPSTLAPAQLASSLGRPGHSLHRDIRLLWLVLPNHNFSSVGYRIGC